MSEQSSVRKSTLPNLGSISSVTIALWEFLLNRAITEDQTAIRPAKSYGDGEVDVFSDNSGIDGSLSSHYLFQGSPNYNVVTTGTTSDGSHYGEDCVLMCHMDGTNNSTVITDSSLVPHTLTAGGSAVIDTGQSKLGGAAAKLRGGSIDSITSHESKEWSFGRGAFSID